MDQFTVFGALVQWICTCTSCYSIYHFFIAMHLLKKKIDQRAVLFYPKHTSWTHGAPWPIGIRNADGTISGRHEAAHTDCSCSLISQRRVPRFDTRGTRAMTGVARENNDGRRQYHGIIDTLEANRFGEDDKQQSVHLPDRCIMYAASAGPFG